MTLHLDHHVFQSRLAAFSGDRSMTNVQPIHQTGKQAPRKMGYVDELFGLPVPAAAREAAKVPMVTPGPDTPLHRSYVFRKDHIKVAQLWLSGLRNNMMLTGPTGSGKTTFVQQLASRTGWGVIKVGCTGSLEFQELMGRITLEKDGSTGWQDGPVLRAMRNGHILFLDEINILHPDVAGGLNVVLDGESYLIPETGERVHPHQDFRIAAAGNGLNGVKQANYRGTKRMNDALLDRFTLGIELDYMAEDDEIKNLAGKAPNLASEVVKTMVELSIAVRKSFNVDESLSITLSTRVLEAWGEVTQSWGKDQKVQFANLLPSLEMTFLFRVTKDDSESIKKALTGIVSRKYPS